MTVRRDERYEHGEDFFDLGGSVTMRLTPDAAVEVCQCAADHQIVIARVEGGIWHNPGFEARLDCIWNGEDPPLSAEAAHANNMRAVEFIQRKRDVHDVFILTAPPITGWPHKASM